VFALLAGDEVLLRSAWCECARVFSTNAKQKHLSHISKVKTNTATVWASVFVDFVPNIAFAFETLTRNGFSTCVCGNDPALKTPKRRCRVAPVTVGGYSDEHCCYPDRSLKVGLRKHKRPRVKIRQNQVAQRNS